MADCLSPSFKLERPRLPAFRAFERSSPLGSRLKQILQATSKALDSKTSIFMLTRVSSDQELRWTLKVDLGQIQALHDQRFLNHEPEAEAGKERRRKRAEERKTPEYKAQVQACRDQLFAERKARKLAQKQSARDRNKALRKGAEDRKKILLSEERFYRRLLEQHERDVLAKAARANIVPEFQDLSFWTRRDLPRWRSEEPGRSPPIRVQDEEEPSVPHPYYLPAHIRRHPCSWGKSRPWSPDLQGHVLARAEFGMYYLDFGRRVPPHPAAS